MRISILAALLLCFSGSIVSAQDFWRLTNGPQDGDIIALASDSSGVLYTSTLTPSGLFYRSMDGGHSWALMSTLKNITGMAVDARGDVYGMYTISGKDSVKNGVWRSRDGGKTWDSMLINSSRSRAIAVAPDGSIFFANDRSFRRSSDRGDSWTDVRIRKDAPAHLANQVQALAIGPSGVIVAGTPAGIYQSADNGASWVPYGAGSSQLDAKTLAIGSDVSYAATDSLLYRSVDNGETWSATSVATRGPIIVMMHPNGDVFAGGFGPTLFRSANKGVDWTTVQAKGLVVRGMVSNREGELIVASALHGIYRSSDHGATWSPSSTGMNNAPVQSIVVAPNGKIFAGLDGYYSGFIYTTTDGGESWSGVRPDSAPKMVWCMVALANGYVIAGTNGTGIYRSIDDGETWEKNNTGLGNLFVRSLAVLPDGSILAGTDQGLYISSDYGRRWRPGTINFSQIWSLAVHPGGRIIAGLNGGGVRYSSDGGVTWRLVETPSTTDIQSLAIDPGGSVYAATYGSGVLRSDDTGHTWQKVLDNRVSNLALLSTEDGAVYLGTRLGVRRSMDKGVTWDSLHWGMGRMTVNTLARDSSGYLYAGTSVRGVARSLRPMTAGIDAPVLSSASMIRLEQNVPNPFSSHTSIAFSIKDPARVHLAVYDLLGNEIAPILDRYLAAGEHSVSLDATMFPPGTYYYELRSGNRSALRKFVVAP